MIRCLPTLYTQRLTLQRPTLDDAARMRWTARSTEDCRAYVMRLLSQPSALPWSIRAENDYVGTMVLSLRATDAECGYALNPDARGRGYATEALQAVLAYALDTMRVERVCARCAEENRASQAVLKRAGMACVLREKDMRLYTLTRAMKEAFA